MNDLRHPPASEQERDFSLASQIGDPFVEPALRMFDEASERQESSSYLIRREAAPDDADNSIVPTEIVERRPIWQRCKRLIDIALALTALIALAPVLAIVAVAIWLRDGGNPLFRHERIGRGLRPFQCLKFRTMRIDADAALEELLRTDPVARLEWDLLHKLTDDPRVTPFGKFLRASSIDEFPQLINVLKGEMSIVGPRPIVRSETARYGRRIADYAHRRPGLTGIWQVSGRNSVSYERRVAMDVIYVRNSSFMLDCQIILKTIPALLRAEGC